MKPLGRRPINFPGKEDCHPRDGYMNWWEDVIEPDKRRERRNSKKEIRKIKEDLSKV